MGTRYGAFTWNVYTFEDATVGALILRSVTNNDTVRHPMAANWMCFLDPSGVTHWMQQITTPNDGGKHYPASGVTTYVHEQKGRVICCTVTSAPNA